MKKIIYFFTLFIYLLQPLLAYEKGEEDFIKALNYVINKKPTQAQKTFKQSCDDGFPASCQIFWGLISTPDFYDKSLISKDIKDIDEKVLTSVYKHFLANQGLILDSKILSPSEPLLESIDKINDEYKTEGSLNKDLINKYKILTNKKEHENEQKFIEDFLTKYIAFVDNFYYTGIYQVASVLESGYPPKKMKIQQEEKKEDTKSIKTKNGQDINPEKNLALTWYEKGKDSNNYMILGCLARIYGQKSKEDEKNQKKYEKLFNEYLQKAFTATSATEEGQKWLMGILLLTNSGVIPSAEEVNQMPNNEEEAQNPSFVSKYFPGKHATTGILSFATVGTVYQAIYATTQGILTDYYSNRNSTLTTQEESIKTGLPYATAIPVAGLTVCAVLCARPYVSFLMSKMWGVLTGCCSNGCCSVCKKKTSKKVVVHNDEEKNINESDEDEFSDALEFHQEEQYKNQNTLKEVVIENIEEEKNSAKKSTWDIFKKPSVQQKIKELVELKEKIEIDENTLSLIPEENRDILYKYAAKKLKKNEKKTNSEKNNSVIIHIDKLEKNDENILNHNLNKKENKENHEEILMEHTKENITIDPLVTKIVQCATQNEKKIEFTKEEAKSILNALTKKQQKETPKIIIGSQSKINSSLKEKSPIITPINKTSLIDEKKE
jgi:hypothetical protein